MTDTTNDRNLLRCTLRKSASVTWRIIKYCSYGAGAAIAGIIGAYVIYISVEYAREIAIENWQYLEDFAKAIAGVILSLVALLLSIPWYAWPLPVAIGTILTYSYLWCLAREFIDEDWYSTETHNFIDVANLCGAVGIFGSAIIAVCGSIGLLLGCNWIILPIGLTGVVLSFAMLVIMGPVTGKAGNSVPNTEYKAQCFIGAYMHYRKRVK